MNKIKALLYILIISLVGCNFFFVPSVRAVDLVGTDPVNDVYPKNVSISIIGEAGDYHDEIDITSYSVVGSDIEVLVDGSTSTWSSNQYFLGVAWSLNINTTDILLTNSFGGLEYPFYKIHASTEGVVLIKFENISMGPNTFYWNGSDFSPYSSENVSVGSLGSHGFTATIPSALLATFNGLKTTVCGGMYDISSGIIYMDIVDGTSSSGSTQDAILGFDVIITIGVISLISIFAILQKVKRKY